MRKIGQNLIILAGIFFCFLSGAELSAEFSQFGSLLGDYFIKYYRPLSRFQDDDLNIRLAQGMNAILNAKDNIKWQTAYHAQAAWQEAIQNFAEASYKAEKQQKAAEAASPSEFKGTNPDGSSFIQYSGRFDIFKEWIKNKMTEMGVFDQWEGESLEELFEKYSDTEFTLTFNKDNDIYVGSYSVMQQKTAFQFSLSNKDKFNEYVIARTIQEIWDSVNNEYSDMVQTTITDNMVWSGKFYDTKLEDGTVVSRRHLLSSRQRTWNETLGTYTESTQENVYVDNTDLAFKTTRHVVETDIDGNYRREYDIIRENMTYEWVASKDPVIGGSWQLKSYDQTFIDSSSPDKTTFSHYEFTYNQQTGLADSQLIVTHETNADGTLDNIYTTVEKYLDYYKDGQAGKQLTFTVEGSKDLDTAINEGKALQTAIRGNLDSGLDLTSVDGLKTYADYMSKVMELIGEGETADMALKKVIASSGEGISDVTGRRINVTYSEKKYNDKGFLGWEKDIIAVRGNDEDGTVLDYSQEVEKTYDAYTPLGQPTKITEVITSEITPDVKTTVEINLEYNRDCTVAEQRTETWEDGLNGKDLNRHTVTVKDNISYDSSGREESYDEEETAYDTSDEIIGHTIREFSGISYNKDGLQESYHVKTTIKGTDTHDDKEFASVTEVDVTDMEYNDIGIRTSWKQTTVNAASPDLSTEVTYNVTQTDQFGRPITLIITEHSFGEADGTKLDIWNTTIQHVNNYNSLGQEEGTCTITIDGKLDEDSEKAIGELVLKLTQDAAWIWEAEKIKKELEAFTKGRKITIDIFDNEYDKYGRLSKEIREINVMGEDGDTKLDYESTITRTGFEYNNAGMLQHYTSTIENESTPDLNITEEVWLGYNDAGQVDYQKTELHEEGMDNKTDDDGVLTGKTEEVDRITTTTESDIKYNTLGLRASWVSEETVKEDGKLITDIKQTYSDIKYDDQGRMIEYTIKVTGKQSSKDEDTGKYGEMQDVDYSVHYSNIKYNELGMRISWDQTTSADGAESATTHWEPVYNEYGEMTDANKTGDGVEEKKDEENSNSSDSSSSSGDEVSGDESSDGSKATTQSVPGKKSKKRSMLIQEESETTSPAISPFDGRQEEKASAEEADTEGEVSPEHPEDLRT